MSPETPPPAWLIRLAAEHPRLWLCEADMTAEELLVRVRAGRSLVAERPSAEVATLLEAAT